MEGDHITHPWLGGRFGLAAVTTDMPLSYDQPLAVVQPKLALKSLDWILGRHGEPSQSNHDPYVARDYVSGAKPFAAGDGDTASAPNKFKCGFERMPIPPTAAATFFSVPTSPEPTGPWLAIWSNTV